MKGSASHETAKRLAAFLLVAASYALAVAACAVMHPTDAEALSIYIMSGIAVFLTNGVVSFLPQVTDWYYENILPHSPRGIRPRRWYAKWTPYYLIILMVIMFVILFVFAAA